MSNILDGFIISSVHNGSEYDRSHLRLNGKCAITEQGLKEHNTHNKNQNTLLTSGALATTAAVFLAGGGIGVALGGEAFGVGFGELVLSSGALGAGAGRAATKDVKGYLRDDKSETYSLVDMIGTVISWQPRWWGMPGYDVQVRWVAADEYGNRTTTTSWHDPEHLVALKKA